MSSTDRVTPERRRFLIRLPRPLWIGLVALMLIAVAAASSIIMPAYWQRAAIRTVKGAGGKVRTRPGGPDWLRRWVGNQRMAIFDEAEFVSLYASSIDEYELTQLGALPRLEKLILLGTPTTDTNLQHIGRLTQLRYLDLEGTRVTDDGLRHLAGLTQLERLDLSRTDVGDNGLLQLEPLKRLTQLRLYATSVTNQGVATLKRAHPRLEVWTSDLAEFEQTFEEPSLGSFFAPQPWHSWKTVLNGRPRVVRFDDRVGATAVAILPNGSQVEINAE